MTAKAKRRLRILAWCALVLALLLAAGWRMAPALLVVDTGLPGNAVSNRVDAIIVLGGESWTRPARAAEVYHELVSTEAMPDGPERTSENPTRPTIASSRVWLIVSGYGDCEVGRRKLMEQGVPEEKILTECKSTSTFENAQFSAQLMRERGFTNAIIVTSWFHSRRALACFEEVAPDMTFYSCPTAGPATDSVWLNRYERDRVLREYGKLLFYWVFYGVNPL